MRLLLAALAALSLMLAQASAQPATGPLWNTPGSGGAAGGAVTMGVGTDGFAYPCGHPSVVFGCGVGRRTAPTGGNVAVATSATTVIPSASMTAAIRVGWQAQGSGYGCASWVTASVTISVNSGSATCGGAGAFLFTVGSTETIAGAAIPTTALTAIAATGASLSIAWQVQ